MLDIEAIECFLRRKHKLGTKKNKWYSASHFSLGSKCLVILYTKLLSLEGWINSFCHPTSPTPCNYYDTAVDIHAFYDRTHWPHYNDTIPTFLLSTASSNQGFLTDGTKILFVSFCTSLVQVYTVQKGYGYSICYRRIHATTCFLTAK